jgi:transposase-like protein
MNYKSLYDLMKTFPDEEACINHLESLRWPLGVICPLCSSSRKIYRITRAHVYKCGDCGKQFSVRKNTIFEESRLPLRKWFSAAWLLISNRKGISSTQLAREIGVTQKTAWLMLGRLREVAEAMGDFEGPTNGEIEADETYIGGKEKNKHSNKKLKQGRGAFGKQVVIDVVERNGKAKISTIDNTIQEVVHEFIKFNINPGSYLYADENRSYFGLTEYNHGVVCHSIGEYIKGHAHTNIFESFWALLKRGYIGVFHHFSEKHLHSYVTEFEARWNIMGYNEAEHLNSILESISGLRLTYKELTA